MLIKRYIDINSELTEEQQKKLAALNSRPVLPDEYCPELTAGQISKMVRVSSPNYRKLPADMKKGINT